MRPNKDLASASSVRPGLRYTSRSISSANAILPIWTVSQGATELIGTQFWLRSISLHTPWPAGSRRRLPPAVSPSRPSPGTGPVPSWKRSFAGLPDSACASLFCRNFATQIGVRTVTTAALAWSAASLLAVPPVTQPPQENPMAIDATAPIAIPCRRRVRDSPCSIEGTCMVFPFARHVSERGHGHPDGVRHSLN